MESSFPGSGSFQGERRPGSFLGTDSLDGGQGPGHDGWQKIEPQPAEGTPAAAPAGYPGVGHPGFFLGGS